MCAPSAPAASATSTRSLMITATCPGPPVTGQQEGCSVPQLEGCAWGACWNTFAEGSCTLRLPSGDTRLCRCASQ